MPKKAKYPWAEWENGATWQIHRGSDYTISTYSMQISLHSRARSRGLKVSSRSFTERERDQDGLMQTREGLLFQFYKEGE